MPSAPPAGSKYKVPNLERALSVLELLVEHPAGLNLTEITQALGCPKNSIFRVTMTLTAHGYLLRDETSKRFTVSRKLLAMGHQVLSDKPLVPTAIDVMNSCRDDLKETVLIGTRVEDHCIVLEQVLGTHPFKFSVDVGTRLALHVSAPGKAMLAYLPEKQRNRLITEMKLTRFNERTITSKKVLRTELRTVRESGFALDRAEQLHGIVCVAAPILNRHGYPVAAIWCTGPSDRLTEAMFAETGRVVRSHADIVSGRLGYGEAT